ncbi:MAG: hypothetical protein AB7G21_00720 [Dehalococcoidia bacterium]
MTEDQPMNSAPTSAPPTPQPSRGSRPGDVRIRRERPTQPSLLGKIASRLRGALPR